MPIRNGRLRFGYAGDGGLGERLIAQVVAGEKTATALPRNEFPWDMLRDTRSAVGQVITVIDDTDRPRARIRIVDVYDTPLASPSPRLLRGEGYNDAGAFIRDHVAPRDDRLGPIGMDAPPDVVRDLAALPVEYRLCVVRHDVYGDSIETIATASGQPPEVVRQLLRRGRMMLRRARGGPAAQLVPDPGDLIMVAVEFELVDVLDLD